MPSSITMLHEMAFSIRANLLGRCTRAHQMGLILGRLQLFKIRSLDIAWTEGRISLREPCQHLR